jgi:hypothetical protein
MICLAAVLFEIMKNPFRCRFFFPAVVLVMLMGCPGRPELIEQKCSNCHKSSVVYEKKRTLEQWDRVLYGMEKRGLVLTPEERTAILKILETNYGLKP